MSTDGDLIYGWRSIAEAAGCSIRHVRDLVTSRQLVTTRRSDGAVAVRKAELLVIAEELRHGRGGDNRGGPVPSADSQIPVAANGAAPTLRVVPGINERERELSGGEHATGDAAAEVFRLFEESRTPIEVVLATKRSPTEVESLYTNWRRLKALDVSSPTAESRLAKVEAALSELRAKLEIIAGHQPVSDAISWAAPRWMHDGIANRVGVIEQALIARGLLVRRTAPTTET